MGEKTYVSVDQRKSLAAQLMEQVQDQYLLLMSTESDSFYQRFRPTLKKTQIDGSEFYVVEGDTLLDEAQLRLYSLYRQRLERNEQTSNMLRAGGLGVASPIHPEPSGLLGIIDSNCNFIRWEEGKVLTYCVLKTTFAGPECDAHFEMVVKNLEQATRDWQNTCNVRFQHRCELDDSNSTRPEEVVFPVRELDTGGAFIAAAFFPNDPIERRRVVIDPSYYQPNLGFDPVGVLRHELGHVLGFRHEHVRKGAPPDCRAEDTGGTEGLTKYDSRSVMHYLWFIRK